MFNLNSWTSVKPGSFESGEAFLTPPFRSRQFIGATIVICLLLIFGVGILSKLWAQLSLLTVFFLVGLLLIVTLQWCRVLMLHKRLHILYTADLTVQQRENTSVDLILRAASSLSYWALITPAAVGFAANLALLYVFFHPRF